MQFLKRFCVALLLVIFASMGASAEQSASSAPQAITLEPGEGITQAMQRVGCNIDWLYQLMYENKVPPVKLRQLPLGSTYTMQTFDCLSKPSEAIVYQSQVIMWTDRDFDRAQRSEAEVASLKDELGAAKKLLEEQQLQTSNPFEHSEYQAKIAELELRLQEAQSKNWTFWTIETGAAGWEVWALGGLLLLVIFFWVLAERKVDEESSINGFLRSDLADVQFKLGKKEGELLEQRQATLSAAANAEIWQRRALHVEKELVEINAFCLNIFFGLQAFLLASMRYARREGRQSFANRCLRLRPEELLGSFASIQFPPATPTATVAPTDFPRQCTFALSAKLKLRSARTRMATKI
ncbi:hypothetical protein C4553_01580 [Candidatus Parcubacteria bacterium]|nr:MAG: hypothetical protein C4553_01580 [Candidatus Parcubacteria bacterium]